MPVCILRCMRCLLLLLVVCSLPAADLTPDPAVTWGTLDNGLRYALMPNAQPKDKVTLRLQVQAGSLQETEPQRGLAHFLEHLAFNGTTHYPPGTLVERLQHLGLAFGAHTNAHTSFEETVYMLELPDAASDTIATGLQVMADWGGGMLLEPAEIDRERGVILAELRDRDGAGLRQARAVYGAQYQGTIIGERLPIGVAETIQAADRALIAGYYKTFYRPDCMVLTVVGAIDPVAVTAQVQTALGGMVAASEPTVDPARGELALTTAEPAIIVHHDAESDDTSVLFQRTMPSQRPVDSVAHRRDELVRALGEAVLARRLRALIEQDPASPLQAAGAFSYFLFGFDHAGIQGTVKPGRALDGLQVVLTEYRRLAEFGPTAAELAIERGSYTAQLDTAVAQAGVRTNPQLAQALYTSAFNREVFLSPAQERELLMPMLASITPAEIVESLQAYHSRPGRELAGIVGREDLGSGAEARVAGVLRNAAAATLTRPVDKAAAVWGYPTDFERQQASGFWQQDEALEGLQGVSAQSRKGLRIQTRASTAQPNQIIILVRLETGVRPRPAGVAELIERGFFAGGLGKHTADEEATLFADSSVKLGGITVGEDGVTMSASCTPADFQRALERLAAHLTDPGWRPEAEARIKQAWDEELAAMAMDIEATTERTLQALLVADDPARRQATRAEAAAVTLAQARAWLDPLLAQAPLTITIAGDLAAAKGYPDVVFAALGNGREAFPAVAATGEVWRTRLAPSPVSPVGRNQVAVTAQVSKAVVRVVWPTDDMYDIRQTWRLNLLANCLSERLRITIREQLGAAYSPAAWHVASEAYRGVGGIHASIRVAPDQADKVAALALDLAYRLAADGIDVGQLDQVKTPVVKSLAARLQRNDWWASVVMPRLATQPFRLQWAGQIEADFAAVTASELSALAAKHLVRAKSLTVIGTAKP